jgi:hypothetical protein
MVQSCGRVCARLAFLAERFSFALWIRCSADCFSFLVRRFFLDLLEGLNPPNDSDNSLIKGYLVTVFSENRNEKSHRMAAFDGKK